MKNGRKERILNSAIKIFSIKGYNGTSMDEIAIDAGVSKGLLFFYYKSKENLIIDAALKSVPLELMNSMIKQNFSDSDNILYELGTEFLNSYSNNELRNLFLYTISSKNKYNELNAKLKELCFNSFEIIFQKVEIFTKQNYTLAKKRSFFGALICYLIWWDDNGESIKKYVSDLVNDFLN
ncbi:TetR/AcrR family transcriptional regulator [Ferroplasma sp.]|uniref:TetR/AcrR family transcriptional regulator n=1 Tax=Ferroplasma sp. TaxID=2591003 RepID=UPI00307F3707